MVTIATLLPTNLTDSLLNLLFWVLKTKSFKGYILQPFTLRRRRSSFIIIRPLDFFVFLSQVVSVAFLMLPTVGWTPTVSL